MEWGIPKHHCIFFDYDVGNKDFGSMLMINVFSFGLESVWIMMV